jgi:hypothetical protein
MKKLLFALLVLALLAGYYVLGTGYFRQRQEQSALAADINAAQQALAQVPARPADLDRRLEEALAAAAAAGESLPERLNTTQTLDAILELAEDNGVKAVPLVTQPWLAETIGGYEYSVFRLDLTVSGDYSRVAAFLAALETGEFETLVIDYLNLTTPDEPEQSAEAVSAGVRVTIYARSADQS